MGALHESGIAALAGTARREKGHQHLDEPALRDIPVTLATLPRLPALALIRFYKETHGNARLF